MWHGLDLRFFWSATFENATSKVWHAGNLGESHDLSRRVVVEINKYIISRLTCRLDKRQTDKSDIFFYNLPASEITAQHSSAGFP